MPRSHWVYIRNSMKVMYIRLILPAAVILCGSCVKPDQDVKDKIDLRVDSLMAKMSLEEKIGQLTLYTSDWDVTGPTMRPGYKEDIKAGRVGAIFNAFT